MVVALGVFFRFVSIDRGDTVERYFVNRGGIFRKRERFSFLFVVDVEVLFRVFFGLDFFGFLLGALVVDGFG